MRQPKKAQSIYKSKPGSKAAKPKMALPKASKPKSRTRPKGY